ncbi:helix-turn-helix transcriptional regulator [Amycolatopsis jejuensis]|uniref:helix-turn-helix transcriptional regulator n=1 Tax=Amycolatopsis jejuensis TaxID=330084 RepID=UPI00068F9583|nr:AraC family transcriptional regulator [Amycolatopsis jejuensis]
MTSSPRLQVSTQDPDEAHLRLTEIYCAHTQEVRSGFAGFQASQKSSGFPGLDLDELGYGRGEVVVKPVPFEDFVLISLPVGGTFAVRSDTGEAVRVEHRSVVMDGYGKHEMRWGLGCRLLNVRLSRLRLEQAAADLRGLDAPLRVRFGLGEPVAAQAKVWDSVVRSLWQHIVPSGVAETSPLVRTQVLRLTVAAALEAFPNSAEAVDPVDPDFVAPSAVRRAVSYIENSAAEDISLRDIAASARVSPRALQVAFRRHRDTTPLRYLRDVRLRRAHQELREADPEGGTTVSEIAFRWGFGNLGRFAEEHRKAFGTTPSQALRDG